jgi:hypothetical protein
MSQSQQRYPGIREVDGPRPDTSETVAVYVGDRARLEGGPSQSPARDLWSSEGLAVFVLSGDSELLATVREAAGNYYPVTPIASWPALRDAVAERRCGVALLDMDSVNGPLTERLEELSRLDPAVVPLVASGRAQANSLMNLLAARKIHRLLIKPPTVGMMRVLLESSVSRSVELRQREQPRLRMEAVVDTRPPPRKSARLSAWLLAACLVVGSLGAAVWFGWVNEPEPPPVVVRFPSAGEPQVTEAPALPAEIPVAVPAEASPDITDVSEALEPAEAPVTEPAVAVSAGAEEVTDDAPAEPVVTALQAVPDSATPLATERLVPEPDPEAPDVDTTMVEDLYEAAQAAFIAGEFEEAAGLIQEIESVEPGGSRLAFLRAQVEREQARLAAEQEAAAQEAELASAAASELTSLIGLARARLEQGQIAAPAGDSALDYYSRAADVDAEAPEVQALAADLGRAVLTSAEVALAEGRFAEAGALLSEAQGLGLSDEELVGRVCWPRHGSDLRRAFCSSRRPVAPSRRCWRLGAWSLTIPRSGPRSPSSSGRFKRSQRMHLRVPTGHAQRLRSVPCRVLVRPRACSSPCGPSCSIGRPRRPISLKSRRQTSSTLRG